MSGYEIERISCNSLEDKFGSRRNNPLWQRAYATANHPFFRSFNKQLKYHLDQIEGDKSFVYSGEEIWERQFEFIQNVSRLFNSYNRVLLGLEREINTSVPCDLVDTVEVLSGYDGIVLDGNIMEFEVMAHALMNWYLDELITKEDVDRLESEKGVMAVVRLIGKVASIDYCGSGIHFSGVIEELIRNIPRDY